MPQAVSITPVCLKSQVDRKDDTTSNFLLEGIRVAVALRVCSAPCLGRGLGVIREIISLGVTWHLCFLKTAPYLAISWVEKSCLALTFPFKQAYTPLNQQEVPPFLFWGCYLLDAGPIDLVVLLLLLFPPDICAPLGAEEAQTRGNPPLLGRAASPMSTRRQPD